MTISKGSKILAPVDKGFFGIEYEPGVVTALDKRKYTTGRLFWKEEHEQVLVSVDLGKWGHAVHEIDYLRANE
jgi:hypothetical protein